MDRIYEIEHADVGETVTFGNYDWIILKKEVDSALLLSKKNICNLPYDEREGIATWEISSIRRWLNGDFYNLFTEDEKVLIANTHLDNYNIPSPCAEGGGDTTDKVFLLSYGEVNNLYFSIGQNVTVTDEEEFWWLRTPGLDNRFAMCVQEVGTIYEKGYDLNQNNGIRPAINVYFSNNKEYLEQLKRKEQDGTEASQEFCELIKDKKEGEIIWFANYEWIILEKFKDKVLLFLLKGMGNNIFSKDGEDAEWENSVIRRWLNVDFYNSLLLWEKRLIINSNIENKRNGKFIMAGGKATVDKFFLLSTKEMEKYLDKIIPLNKYYTEADVPWGFWLRTMGDEYSKAAYAELDNKICHEGTEGFCYYYPPVIRPAVYLQLK